MRPHVVMDSNVAFVGNRQAEQAGPGCILACVDRMARIREHEKLVLDDGGRILEEYPRPTGQPGLGDAFVKWVWTNLFDPKVCRLVQIEPHEERGFAEFPDDEDLAGFDQDDRKFVAVAVAAASASGKLPPILNASDRDWWDHRDALARHGVDVEFLCPELMKESA